MAKVITTELQHSGASGANITLDSSKNVTCENNLTVDGTTTLTGAVTLPAGTTSDTLSFRNLIINGAMQVAQRSTSVAVSDGSNEGYQSLDRYKTYTNNSGAYTVSQDTDVPTDYTWGRFRNSYKVDVTTADTSIGAGDLIRVHYNIEAQDISNSGWDYTNSSGKLTISFWAKSVKAGTYVVLFQTEDGTAHSYASEYTLSANTWTHITKTIPGNSNLTIDDNNGTGLMIHWILCSGSDANLTADTWTSGYKYGTTNQANLFDDAANNFWFTGVQVEVGDTATKFEHRSYADELVRCERYYQKIGDANSQAVGTGFFNGSSDATIFMPFLRKMRTAPSLTTLTSNKVKVVRASGADQNCDTSPSFQAGSHSCNFYMDGLSDGDLGFGAQLRINGTASDSCVRLDAEL